MLTISAYRLVAQLYESANSLIYRGRRVDTEQPVVLKMLKDTYPTPERIAWFKREYEVTRNLTIPGVVDAYALIRDTESLVMVLEDFGGDSLALLGIAGQLELSEFLKLAIAITEILGQIHAANIIHKDINPSNIVLNRTTGQVKIIDFGISTVLSRENLSWSNPKVLEGTLAYISPEQTGRMNRAVDYRSDFYSLGVTFYELLTGQLPFESSDALELVHSHIARVPIPPHEIVGTRYIVPLPSIVSDIVMKLMAKNAEDRYQSAYGIKADLEIGLHLLQTKGQIDVFPLGEQDISDRFTIPQKLYGREREIETLLAAFERVAGVAGEAGVAGVAKEKFLMDNSPWTMPNSQCPIPHSKIEMVLVAGYSGVGKSALVREIHKPITALRGNFISGKFNQYQRNIPYYALSQAFNDLCNQLLTESEAVLNEWREKILAAVGNNGQVLIDVIPNLERVIGSAPPVVQVGPNEAQNRFNLVFQNFIKAICQRSHPLVIFIDDLQWADAASLNLLKTIMSDATIQYLLIIGAYRDNEVNLRHGLMMTLDEIENQQGVLSFILLDNLLVQDVNALIAESLDSEAALTQPLTDLVYEKTQGNPFFTVEFLKSLYSEGLLTFEYGTQSPTPLSSPRGSGGQRGVGGWKWDVAQIQAKEIADNVVELMVAKINNLATKTQNILQLAACIGNKFDLTTLGIISQHQPTEVLTDLFPAIQSGLVVPRNNLYKLIDTGNDFAASEVSFQFLHDRVQHAAYSLIDDAQKTALHLQIGRLLLQNTAPEALSEKIFEIVDHLNLGVVERRASLHQQERLEIAKLNLLAGQKAKAATAYKEAFEYLNVGLKLLRAESWLYSYDLTLALHEEAAEAAYLTGDFIALEELAEIVQQQAVSLLHLVKVYEVRIQGFIAQNKQSEALEVALQILQLLGIKFPDSPTQADITLGLQETQLALQGKELRDLIDLPEMTDSYQMAAMCILSTIISVTFQVLPALFPLIVFKQVNLSVKYGNSAVSAFAYATYGIILCGVVGDIDSGYQAGQLALKMLERLNNKKYKTRTWGVVYGSVIPWKKSIRETLQPLLSTYQSRLETGDLEYAAYPLYIRCYSLLITAACDLVELEREMATSSNAITQLKQETVFNYNEIFRQVVLNLLGRSVNPCRLVGESYNEEKMFALHIKANERTTIYFVYLNKLILCYLFKEYHQAVENATLAEDYLDGVTALLVMTIFHFYDSLARLAVHADAAAPRQEQIIKKVSANQEKMKKWAHHAPMNHLHKFYLVEAELARVLGQNWSATDFYERAIKGARDNGYIQEEALAYELAAEFYLACDRQQFAQLYMTLARSGYVHWQAIAKVRDLESRYPQFFIQTPSTTTTTTSTPDTQTALDLTSILKASSALCSEIVLENLLAKIMKLVFENAGAQLGYLILEKDGQWLIEASGTIESDDIQVLQSIPIETVSGSSDTPMVSQGIVNYVRRTQETIILNDALHEGYFTRDPYIVKLQPKSVLCAPLLNQGKLTGFLYLENNQTTGAFTTDRLSILKLLTAQASILIENAKLYTNLQAYSQELEAEIADRLLAESALRISEERFRLAIANIPNTFVIYDAQRRLQFVNAFGVRRSGYSEERLLGYRDEEIFPPEVTNSYLPLLLQTVETRTRQTGECQIILPGADPVTIVVTYVPLLNELGEIHQIIGITHDITERKRAESQLHHDAFHDALTGLPNRALFMEHLKDALNVAQQSDLLFAVLFLDMDGFKVINDSKGHLVGDQFLKAIASRLEACLGSKHIVARLGGDEFTVLLVGLKDVSEALNVADRIQQTLSLPFDLDGQQVFTTASIGIALSVIGYSRPEDLLRDADTAMYRAKALGRGRIELFNLDMYSDAVARLHLETDLRRAIERFEFRVYYQPIVSLTSGIISGFEALVRWQHPERGLVSPADFIPLAEETGLIVPIGNWVLLEACRFMQAMRVRNGSAEPLFISVNLSVKQFSEPTLIQQIAQILQSTGLLADALVLEITESAIMENGDEAIKALKQLRSLGIKLSIDDFGTGYSSLGRLHSFPINSLKIDRSFVSPGVAGNLEIISTIVTLAHKLGYSVTAEGVETASQLALLRQLNCEYGQGRFFSPALDSSAAEALIIANPQW